MEYGKPIGTVGKRCVVVGARSVDDIGDLCSSVTGIVYNDIRILRPPTTYTYTVTTYNY
jgi:hypothetical protein